jgi:hypothetical protein
LLHLEGWKYPLLLLLLPAFLLFSPFLCILPQEHKTDNDDLNKLKREESYKVLATLVVGHNSVLGRTNNHVFFLPHQFFKHRHFLLSLSLSLLIYFFFKHAIDMKSSIFLTVVLLLIQQNVMAFNMASMSFVFPFGPSPVTQISNEMTQQIANRGLGNTMHKTKTDTLYL